MRVRQSTLGKTRRFCLLAGVFFLLVFQSLAGTAAGKPTAKNGGPLPSAVLDSLLACMDDVHTDVDFRKPFSFQYWYGPSERNPGDPDEVFIILYAQKHDEAVFWNAFVGEENGKPLIGSITESRLKRDRKAEWTLVDIWDGGWTGEHSMEGIRRASRARLQTRSVKLKGSQRVACYLQSGPVWR